MAENSKDSAGLEDAMNLESQVLVNLVKKTKQTVKDLDHIPVYQPVSKLSPEASFLTVYKIIPLAGGFFADVASSVADITRGEGLGEFIRLTGNIPPGLTNAAEAMPYVGLGSHLFNLGRMAVIWNSAKLLDRPIPFNFTKKAKIFYSSAALMLGILIMVFALINPPIAVGLGVAAASLGFVSATATLAKTVWHRYKEKQESHSYTAEINKAEAFMQAIKNDIKACEIAMDKALTANDENLVLKNINKIRVLKASFDVHYQDSQVIYEKRHLLQQEMILKKEHRSERFTDKVVGIPLSILSVIGAILALSNPVLGLALAGVGLGIGLGFVVIFRITLPLLRFAYKSFMEKKEIEAPIKEPVNEKEEDHPYEHSKALDLLMTACSIEAHNGMRKRSNAQPPGLKATIDAPMPKAKEDDSESEGESDDDSDDRGEAFHR